MRRLVTSALLSLFITLPTQSAQSNQLYSDHQKSVLAPITTIDGVRVSATQACQSRKCDAVIKTFQQTQSVHAPTAAPHGSINPAEAYCGLLGGKSSDYYDEQMNEVPVCIFSDKSFVLSWDALRKYRRS